MIPSPENISAQFSSLLYDLQILAAANSKVEVESAVNLVKGAAAAVKHLLKDTKTVDFHVAHAEEIIYNLVQTNKKIPAIKFLRDLPESVRSQIQRNYNHHNTTVHHLDGTEGKRGLANAKSLVETIGRDFFRI